MLEISLNDLRAAAARRSPRPGASREDAGGTHGHGGEQERRGSAEAEEAVGAVPGEPGPSPAERHRQRQGPAAEAGRGAAEGTEAGAAVGAGDELVPAHLRALTRAHRRLHHRHAAQVGDSLCSAQDRLVLLQIVVVVVVVVTIQQQQ